MSAGLAQPPGTPGCAIAPALVPSGAMHSPKGQRAAEEFEAWLGALLKRLPKAPVLPPEATDRAHIYDE